MIELIRFFLSVLASLSKLKGCLEAENAALRHQLIDLRRKAQGRVLCVPKVRFCNIGGKGHREQGMT
jgi:hypothetical protein